MMNTNTTDAAALARLTQRLAGTDLVGFGHDADRLATAKVGQSKEPPPPDNGLAD